MGHPERSTYARTVQYSYKANGDVINNLRDVLYLLLESTVVIRYWYQLLVQYDMIQHHSHETTKFRKAVEKEKASFYSLYKEGKNT